MKILDVKNLKYASTTGESIDMEVLFDHFPEYLPFTANANDTVSHGRDLFNSAVSGAYGDIAAYDGPSDEELAASAVRQQRNRLLRQVDVVVSNPLRWEELSQTDQSAYAEYRQALLDVPQQDGFPFNVEWPVL